MRALFVSSTANISLAPLYSSFHALIAAESLSLTAVRRVLMGA